MSNSTRVSKDDNPFLAKLGIFLQRKREKSCMKQEDIAQYMGRSRVSISRIECGKNDFNVSYLPVFSTVYGFPMSDYFRDENIIEGIKEVRKTLETKIKILKQRECAKHTSKIRPYRQLTARVYMVDGVEIIEPIKQRQVTASTDEVEKYIKKFDIYDVKPFDPESEEDMGSLTEEDIALIYRTTAALELLSHLSKEARQTSLAEKLADYILNDVYRKAAKDRNEFSMRMCAYIAEMGKVYIKNGI